MIKASFILFILFSLSGAACAQSYYADVTIDIDASGISQVSGSTNHPLLKEQQTNAMTSKTGAVWLFNLTLPAEDIFSDYVYTIDLPPGASINYVKADSFRITSPEGNLRVSGSASNKPFSIVIQYRTEKEPVKDYSQYLIVGSAFALLGVLGLFLVRKNRRKKTLEMGGTDPEKVPAPDHGKYHEVLTDRQKDILRILSEEGKPVNQTAICRKLDLPKSSVSRNVSTLCDLGLVEKKRIGMSTFLSLPKE